MKKETAKRDALIQDINELLLQLNDSALHSLYSVAKGALAHIQETT